MNSYEHLEHKSKVCVNSYATECFRDVADRDYISARVLYRLGIFDNFYWAAGQAIEKYLKGILLFNFSSAKSQSHGLYELFEDIKKLDLNCFSSSNFENDFIRRFAEKCKPAVRYAQLEIHCYGPVLSEFDHFIWSIRRYCQQFHVDRPGIDAQKCKESMLREVVSEPYTRNPHTFKINGGLLEKIMKSGRNNELRKALIWKNCFYSSKKVYDARPVEHYVYRRNFVLDHPECNDILRDTVIFSK